MEKERELTKAFEKILLDKQKRRFQEFSEDWKSISQGKDQEKIKDFYYDFLDFHYDVYFSYGGKNVIQIVTGE